MVTHANNQINMEGKKNKVYMTLIRNVDWHICIHRLCV